MLFEALKSQNTLIIENTKELDRSWGDVELEDDGTPTVELIRESADTLTKLFLIKGS